MEPTVTDQTAGVVTYRVVKIEDCATGPDGLLRVCTLPDDFDGMVPFMACDGCQGDGTRMVDHGEIERAPDWWWSPTEQAATAGTWGHGDDRAVWVEVES